MSAYQFHTSNKAWQPCGVEERWKGWQLLLRRLPAAAKSLSSHLFAHTQITRGSHFFPTNPHNGTRTVWQRAKRGNKKLEKILNSRELLVDFLGMDCCTPRASPGSGPTWFGQILGQTNAGPFQNDFTRMTKWRCSSPGWERRSATPPPALLLVPMGGRVLMLPAPARAE